MAQLIDVNDQLCVTSTEGSVDIVDAGDFGEGKGVRNNFTCLGVGKRWLSVVLLLEEIVQGATWVVRAS
jgi:hypothetical protein